MHIRQAQSDLSKIDRLHSGSERNSKRCPGLQPLSLAGQSRPNINAGRCYIDKCSTVRIGISPVPFIDGRHRNDITITCRIAGAASRTTIACSGNEHGTLLAQFIQGTFD